MQTATFLHGSHDHSFLEELLEGFAPILPGGEKTVEFLGHLFTDLLQIYLLLLVILFVVFWLQSLVDTDRMQLIANILSGLFAAVAGICTVSMNGAAQPTTGQDWMIYSFAVSVIGGTALAGGVICPIGIAIAAFLVVIIKNGLVMLNANIYFEQTYLGLILLGAVSIGSVSAMVSEVKRRRRFRREQAAGEKK